MSSKVTQNDPDWIQTVSPLIAALRRGHYFLYSQKIQALQPVTGERPYQEILIRYLEEERRMLPPGMFLPVLQEQGLMSLMDCWVVNQVLKLQEAGIAGRPGWRAPRNSVNLSEDSIVDPEFSDFVITQLKARNTAPDTLSFEVLESTAVANPVALQDLIAALQPVDCTFAIGSFSASPEGMKLIENLPVSFVKIDGSLTRRMMSNAAAKIPIRVLIERCRELGIRTIAEQVENNETLMAVTEIGIDFAQGFGISNPAPLLSD